MGWGGGAGWQMGPMGGGQQAGQETGLPFAGIPPEYAQQIDVLLDDEEEIPIPDLPFTHVEADRKRFTLRSFLLPHWLYFTGAAALIGLDALALNIGPWLLQLGIDEGVWKKDFGTLQLIVLGYFVAIVTHLVVARQRILFTGKLGQHLMNDLRIKLFTHLQRLSLDFYSRERAGRIMTRMTSDIPAMEQLIQEGVVNLAMQAATSVVVTGFLITMDVRLTLVVLLGVVPAMVLMTLWFRRESTHRYAAVRERIADVLADLQESLSGVRIVAMHRREHFNVRRHRAVVDDYREANLSAARVSAIYGPGADFVGSFGQIVVLVIGGGMVLSGDLSVGKVSAFVLYINTFFAPIQQLVQLHTVYQQGQAAAKKLRDVFDTQPSVPETPDATPLPPLEGKIEFDDVTFGYDDGRMVLHDLSFSVNPGETFALVGETGAGKSTVVKLVTRFYDPQQGSVAVDGCDLRGVQLESLRRQLGVVPQEPFLFAGSIRDNLAFARPGASDEDVLAACQAVGINDLIERLPQGIDTPCHERGVTLSSGERQLLALVRAFLAQPRVLILDEATSNLDLKTEAMVEHALDTLLEGRTAILIAHRLSTAMRADRIGVLQDGHLVEIGSHNELLAQGGSYAELFETWLRHGGSGGERA